MADTIKYLDSTGLAQLVKQIKAADTATLNSAKAITGDLTSLSTTEKSTLVAAINEVKSAAAAVLGEDGDAATAATVYGVKAAVKAVSDGLGTAAAKDVATAAISAESTDASVPTVAQVAAFVKGQVADLEGALHFKGIKSATSDVTDAASGDVIIIGTKEYIYDGSDWKELGDEGAYAPKTRTIAGLDLVDDITVGELETALSLSSYAKTADLPTHTALTAEEIATAFGADVIA